MKVIPFGEVKKERFEACKERGLIEQVAGIWRLTDKCREKYQELSFFQYMQGKIYPPEEKEKQNRGAIIQGILEL